MRECRYYGMCRSMVCDPREAMHQSWDDNCTPCSVYFPMPDVESLNKLANDLCDAYICITSRESCGNQVPVLMLIEAAKIIDTSVSNSRFCSQCNLCREVAMHDGSRILVCDGGSDELEQVSEVSLSCEKFEER